MGANMAISGKGGSYSPPYDQVMASKRTIVERQKSALSSSSGLNAAPQAAALTNQVGGGNIGFTYE